MSLRSPLITRSSSAEGVRKLHQLYKTTFQQDVPIADKSNHLRVFLAICNTIGFEQDQLDHLRETFPSLSQVIWEDVASIANLDPAKGREQVKHAPVRFDVRLSMDLILRMKEDHCVALEIYKLPEWHTETAEHLHLTSYMIRGILALFGSLILSSAERIVPPRDTSSGGTIEVPLRLYNGLTLLVVEYEFRVLPQNRKQILAHLLAKLVAAAALNRQQGYTFNVHGMVTDLKETIWYTYNPRSGKFHVRGHVEIGGCNKTPEGLPVRESVAFMQKMALVTRFTLALLLEGYHDYLEETLAKYQLPPSVISLYLETLHLAEWDAHAYETYMRTKVSLPSDNTIVALTPRQRLIAVMHTYLSHLNFDLTSDSKPTRLVLQDGDGENVVGGTLWYTIPGLNTLRCALEASPYVVSDQPLNALNCYIRMDYVPSGETPFSNPVRISFWRFSFSRYFDRFPHFENDVGSIGFAASIQGGAEGMYREFTNDLVRYLFCPFWGSVKATFRITIPISTESAERAEKVALSIRRFNQAVEKLRPGSDLEVTAGLELLAQSVQAYPREDGVITSGY